MKEKEAMSSSSKIWLFLSKMYACHNGIDQIIYWI